MCQILVFNAIHTIVTDMECIIRIDRLPLVNATFNNISVNSFAISYKVLFFLNNHLPTAFDEQTFKASNKISPNILLF